MTSAIVIISRNHTCSSRDVCHRRLLRMSRYPTITKQSFLRNYKMLCNELEMNSLIPYLREMNILTQIEIDRINNLPPRRRKAGEFLEILFEKESPEWIESVLLCFERNNFTNIIRILEGTARQIEYPIRPLRPQQYEYRVWFDADEEISRAIQSNEDSQILEDANAILDCSIVSIYTGSLCFLLDPMSEKALLDMWTSDRKLRVFLNKLFSTYKGRQCFQQKKEIRVTITEKSNDFIFRENDTKDECSGCFRQTVFKNYVKIIDEIETSMMEKTFMCGVVPGCIKTACIDDKDKRSRSERADIFLRFVLTSEKLLMEFKKIFRQICKIDLEICTCYLHGGQKSIPVACEKPIQLYFEVSYSSKDDVLTVIHVNKENSLASSDSTDIISKPIFP